MSTRSLLCACTLALGACGDGIDPVPDEVDAGIPDAVVTDAQVIDGGGVDAVPADAAISACGATGTYVEADDPGNDAIHGGNIEATGLPVNGTQRTIGGCIDPQYADASAPPVADADVYSVSLSAANFVSGRIVSPAGAAADGGTVLLVDSGTTVVARAVLAGGEALLPPVYLPAGNYLVTVMHPDPAPAAVYAYSVELKTYSCTPQISAPDYTESGDGFTGRGNDIAAVDWDVTFTDFTMTATAADDDAENAQTLVTGGFSSRRRIDGNSASNGSDGDDYLDRDTYLIRTGGSIRRLLVVADWISANNDLDFLVVPENQVDADAVLLQGTNVDSTGERSSGLVDPSGRYWIWVGNRSGAIVPFGGLAYRLTLCGYP